MARKDLMEIQNAKLMFRNFAGEAKQFNAEGLRNFCVLLPTDVAQNLEKVGWNIKWLKPRDPADDPQAYMQVKVVYDNYPPHVILISNGYQRLLTKDTISILDFAEIENADLTITPYNWEVNGKKGIQGYLKSLYVTLVPEDFAGKYSNVPYADYQGDIN